MSPAPGDRAHPSVSAEHPWVCPQGKAAASERVPIAAGLPSLRGERRCPGGCPLFGFSFLFIYSFFLFLLFPAQKPVVQCRICPARTSGLLNFTPRAATEVASEQHETWWIFFYFFKFFFLPTKALGPSWPEWQSTFKSLTRISHVVSR